MSYSFYCHKHTISNVSYFYIHVNLILIREQTPTVGISLSNRRNTIWICWRITVSSIMKDCGDFWSLTNAIFPMKKSKLHFLFDFSNQFWSSIMTCDGLQLFSKKSFKEVIVIQLMSSQVAHHSLRIILSHKS